jgi:hypothetical protein
MKENPAHSSFRCSRNTPLLLLGMVIGCACIPSANAAVEAVRIWLVAATGQSVPISYAVPSGQVLILEHVVFADYWDHKGQPKEILLRNRGTSVGGLIADTHISYGGNFNTLFRPLKLPAGTGISLPNLGDGTYSVFLYGLLVDVEDLYASIPSQPRDLERTESASGTELAGTLELQSPRPATVRAETSDDMSTWDPAPDVEVTANADNRKRDFTIPLDGLTDRRFVRFSARALMREDYPSYQFPGFLAEDALAENGTVSTPFLDNPSVAPRRDD